MPFDSTNSRLRRKRFLVIGVIGLVVVIGLSVQQVGRWGLLSSPSNAAEFQQVAVDEYCVQCHNSQDFEAGLALDSIDHGDLSANVDIWEKVIRKLKTGQMPPTDVSAPSRPRPDRSIINTLAITLEQRIDALPGATSHSGEPLLGRLNRAEYTNAIRDLFGIDVDVSVLLPPDDAAYGFDNVADALGNSPALLQSYLTAARRISAMAVGDPDTPPGSITYSVRQDRSQDRHIEGMPPGTIGGMSATHLFPVDGEYEFQVRLYRTNLSAMRGLEDPHQLELAVDGEQVLLASIGGTDDLIALQTNPTLASDTIEAERLRIRVFIEAGQREVGAVFLGETPALFDTTRLQPFTRDFNPYDAEGSPHVQSISVAGPFNVVAESASPSPTLFVCRPQSSAEELPCARRIISAVAARAYRRPLTEDEIDGLLSFYISGREGEDFNAGIQLALRRILASPSFVFLPEEESVEVAQGEQYRLTDFELATRLSLFLWSTIPDEELLSLAGDGRLQDPAVLADQIDRMLDSPKSFAFTRNFAGQWLHLRNLAGIVPNSDLFPDFDDNLREAFRQEAELFFDSVLRENRSVLDLLQGRDSFVNERLARHYGMDGVFGSDFRSVRLTDERRFGLLGKGAVLLATSHPNSTSPVLRGKWVLENLLGIPPPPPPPELDTSLKEPEPGTEPRTMREQLERHQEDPVCSQCHRFMDPIGFALENFDVTGAWRETNDAGIVLDTGSVLFEGSEVEDVADLRQALMQRPEVFVQTLTEKLMVYGLRRGLTYEDMPVVREIIANLRDDEFRFVALIHEIVQSTPFQMRVRSVEPDSATPTGEETI